VLAYQQTVQNSLEQVSNAPSHNQKIVTSGAARMLTQAAERFRSALVGSIQHGGASSTVLTNETNYFSAELNLVQAQLNERSCAGPSSTSARWGLATVTVWRRWLDRPSVIT